MNHNLNTKPHLLHARIHNVWAGAIHWTVECPHEGVRPCGTIEICHGTPEDAAKWGCKERPIEPKGMPEDEGDNATAWQDFFRAEEEWKTYHEYAVEYYGHRTETCWFTEFLSEFDPEYYLAAIPSGTPIVSPMEVAVEYDGHGEECEPLFKLWKDYTNEQG